MWPFRKPNYYNSPEWNAACEIARWREADAIERDMQRYRLFGPDEAVVREIDMMEYQLQALERHDGVSPHE